MSRFIVDGMNVIGSRPTGWWRDRPGAMRGLVGEVDADRAVEIISAGAEPLRELIGAMHSKLLLAELRRQRGES